MNNRNQITSEQRISRITHKKATILIVVSLFKYRTELLKNTNRFLFSFSSVEIIPFSCSYLNLDQGNMCVLKVRASEIDGSNRDKPPANGTNQSISKAAKEKLREDRERLVLWYEPVLTLKYSTLETVELLRTHGEK